MNRHILEAVKEMKRFLLLLPMLLLGICFLLLRDTQKAILSVRVVDGMTDTPLDGAEVVIAETGNRYPTDMDGLTERIAVPFIPEAIADTKRAPWREVTVLVYRDGYYTAALYHVSLAAGEVREGLTVRLFADDASMDDRPFVLIEAPPTDWSRALIERFKPSDPHSMRGQ